MVSVKFFGAFALKEYVRLYLINLDNNKRILERDNCEGVIYLLCRILQQYIFEE